MLNTSYFKSVTMLSDDSSSDSETGRFKCRTKPQDEQSSKQKYDKSRSSERRRQSDSDRLKREFDKKRDDRNNYARDRQRHSRPSPVIRRRHSRDRSPYRRRSPERHHNRDSRARSNTKDRRSGSRDKPRHSNSRSHKPPELKRDLKEEIKRNLRVDKVADKVSGKSSERSSSPVYKGKQSVIQKPPPTQSRKRKSESPIIVDELGESENSEEEVQPGSYYNMIPAVVKDKSEESSEIDSSDDEKLRAKLLNIEKELHKTKKKKHKKKHKRKLSKSSKERDYNVTTTVEVSSTTDIEDKSKTDVSIIKGDTVVEVSSTQKPTQKDSSEEGEISSDDDSQNNIDIAPTDLRHKLRRSTKRDKSQESKDDVCGPALPPHLQKQAKKSSTDFEGPALPPHLKQKPKNIGPSIPDDLRKTLAESDHEVINYESSDNDDGYGPVPVGGRLSEIQQRLEERALEMKIKKLDSHGQNTKIKSREQWMLELPEAKTKFLGLEARSFRAKQGPDMSDRSSWTDTPEEKSRKAAGHVKEEDLDETLKREAKTRNIAGRDNEQEAAVKKHKKKHKRDESLLDMHQKKLKKKKKKDESEEGKKERRPFSRDVDLQANRFDEAQKKSIIKKAQDLNTRFSRGEAKYL
ncbi:hypothetical protein K1T71_003370 [Dendrolimus kikuchii]|uniref:Uncharacterized protein n=1 Tax=Dendrolimus kikuchii TaxID=765133 RepID=A0ACC1DBS4_9NEOP|nr:hypothetical protein K1T71_003370 [Dendrolimus kikuchii]